MFWDVLGRLVSALRVSWGVLGASWGRLNASWENLGDFLGASWGRLGASFGVVGVLWGASWAVLVRLGAPSVHLGGVLSRHEKQ